MKLEICTIIKDEGRFLEEWIEFHLLQGVDKFWLYDNGSTDNTLKVLERYRTLGIVELIEFKGDAMQPVMCQLYCVNNAGLDKWCAFIDVDEFLLIRDRSFLDKAKAYGGVCVNWRLMGSYGHVQRPEGLVLENYPMGQKGVDRHVKTILNMRYAIGRGRDVHSFRSSRPIINLRGEVQPVNYALSENPVDGDALQLFHFHVKSQEDYRFKCSRNRADVLQKRNFEESFSAHDINDVKLWMAEWGERIRGILKNKRNADGE